MSVDIYLVSKHGVMLDKDRKPCIVESPQNFKPLPKYNLVPFQQFYKFQIDLNRIKAQAENLFESYYFLIIFDIDDKENKEDDYGIKFLY